MHKSELAQQLYKLARSIDPDRRPALFGDDDPDEAPKAPRSEDERWQAIEDMAYAIDGDPSKEDACLWATREHFRGCDSKTDWPGYVVCHLLESLMLNRGHKLRRLVPTAGARGSGNGDVDHLA